MPVLASAAPLQQVLVPRRTGQRARRQRQRAAPAARVRAAQRLQAVRQEGGGVAAADGAPARRALHVAEQLRRPRAPLVREEVEELAAAEHQRRLQFGHLAPRGGRLPPPPPHPSVTHLGAGVALAARELEGALPVHADGREVNAARLQKLEWWKRGGVVRFSAASSWPPRSTKIQPLLRVSTGAPVAATTNRFVASSMVIRIEYFGSKRASLCDTTLARAAYPTY
ncbi:hypothetical protein JKP88DRAFT_266950 [Tribonema minus]|uniref:Uncharacterized protein n=1 Tax=Tribonema minus TaxID=303371 RepID=A0A836CL30_9STRA|nr:hypothetical protein JKP88DRAFT_266950 [Tribonema minus]